MRKILKLKLSEAEIYKMQQRDNWTNKHNYRNGKTVYYRHGVTQKQETYETEAEANYFLIERMADFYSSTYPI
ncbi:hypothetical protein [uncultured Vagococcus sp.]|uniref:hypothetical protein n=1 Tax=uncultured Vagococcus sp. TaxID=189676 RepID=UPI0028D719F7|nr:hypothetical protein [uncultured Vagococcus sp.]